MKRMELLKLTLRNFKGIKDFTLEANGENVSVFGDNGTGKTTLFDAFIWLLFDKDSQNKKDFEIKTLDENNNVIHNLEHEVEGVFKVGDKPVTLRKVFKEKWTKRRGSAKKEFTGHTTDYYVDGVPMKKKEYEARVVEITDEDIFKLLTSPTYFSEQLHWEDRRKALVGICGDVSDDDVIQSDKSFARLPDILEGRSVEGHKDMVKNLQKGINKELETISVRISEVQRSIPDVSGINEKALYDEIAYLKSHVEEKEKGIARILSGGEVATKEKRFLEIQSEMMQLKNDYAKAFQDDLSDKRQAIYQTKDYIESLRYEVGKRERLIGELHTAIKAKKTKTEALRSEYHHEYKKTLNFEQDDHCPACGQPIPEDELNAARKKAQETFNRDKAKRLEAIKAEGKKLSEEINAAETEVRKLSEEKEGFEKGIVKKQADLDALLKEMELLEAFAENFENDPAYKEKEQEAHAVKQEIEELRSSSHDSVEKVRAEIAQLQNKIQLLEEDKAKITQVQQANERIKELEQEESTLAAKFEKLEEELYLVEQFTRTKVSLLEEKINRRFRHARFKLFNNLVNSGIEECCEATFNGVPYNSMNNAAKILVGLDIIETLSDHYGFSATIFIDNAEAITNLPKINSQMIALYVSEKDKQLRVERQQTSVKEAV